jgi:hypothetical protein
MAAALKAPADAAIDRNIISLMALSSGDLV